jgi:hypothetical protein
MSFTPPPNPLPQGEGGLGLCGAGKGWALPFSASFNPLSRL